MTSTTLIIGACGQIGSELTNALRNTYGKDSIIASDIRESNLDLVVSGPFEIIDAKDYQAIKLCIEKYNVDTVYLMAALLSATGEKYPEKAWDLNMTSLFNVLNLAKEGYIKKVFWPSSIAVFGPTTPALNTPQHTVMEPTTVYGITKQVGERWCEYYHKNYNVDVRSIRYPGIISWRTKPGGGTTDYAVEIFHSAIEKGTYSCFLEKDTVLPMMFMDDAVKATLDIMKTDTHNIKIRSSYNLSAISFTPEDISNEIKKHMPNFKIEYKPDFRQKIADSWPNSIDDTPSRKDWNWQHNYNLEDISLEMLEKLKEKHLM